MKVSNPLLLKASVKLHIARRFEKSIISCLSPILPQSYDSAGTLEKKVTIK
jgi:hypothetical protein